MGGARPFDSAPLGSALLEPQGFAEGRATRKNNLVIILAHRSHMGEEGYDNVVLSGFFSIFYFRRCGEGWIGISQFRRGGERGLGIS